MSQQDEELVKNTINKYLSAVIKGIHSDAVDSWHPDGKRIIIDEQSQDILFQNSPASEEFSNYSPNPKVSQVATIENIDITGTAALVKLKWDVRFLKAHKVCVDYLLLIKTFNSWKIVGKVSDIAKKD